MMQDTSEFLSLFAEVAIATVALSGIIMVLAVSGMHLSKSHISRIAQQLRMALIATVFSLLPLLANSIEWEIEILWRSCSALYLSTILYVIYGGMFGKPTYIKPVGQQMLVTVAGVSGLTLLGLNLWLANSWPYLLQLTIALVVSMVLFLEFILEILADKEESS